MAATRDSGADRRSRRPRSAGIHPSAAIGESARVDPAAEDGPCAAAGDDVEAGANSTIDRGSTQDTVTGVGTRLDNLVQIGHNARLGRRRIVVAQAGISGSTVLEDFVVVAAQAGVTGHSSIGSRARIGAQAGVMAGVDAGAEVVGSPAQPVRGSFRPVAPLRRPARRPGKTDQ